MVLLFDFIYRQFIHYPPAPTTASFRGQTIIVTGGSGGLGLAACRSMLEKGAAKVIIACRNVDKGKTAAQGLRELTSCGHDAVDVWPLDLGSYASVVKFSERVKSQLERLDVLVANAGVHTTNFRKVEGDEETIVTNVISAALLALLVHPKLRETAARFRTQTHITFTGSELYEVAKFKERHDPSGQIFATLGDEEKSAMGDRYNVSKLLLLFVLKRMSELSPLESSNVIVNVVAPGYVSFFFFFFPLVDLNYANNCLQILSQ
jgi:NAD(P)-dependent dehydrogenase (short-subunit alcohol dehydrogenase family)